MLPKYYQDLGSYNARMVTPRLEPAMVPKTSRCLWGLGYAQAGAIPYGHCQVDPWIAPKAPMNSTGLGQAIAPYNTNNVFVGRAPNQGVYTGVKRYG
jgi:hypothetical protein